MFGRDEILRNLGGKRITESNYDIGLLLMSFMSLPKAHKLEKYLMEKRKDLDVGGYKFAIGIIDHTHFTVGFLSWPTIKGVTQDDLRNYRFAMFQAQQEMGKMQSEIEQNLRSVILG